MRALIVTGYIELGNGRTKDYYLSPGARLLSIGRPVVAFIDKSIHKEISCIDSKIFDASIDSCYLYRATRNSYAPTEESIKDTVDYMVVQHQKTEWISLALRELDYDVAIWVDFGILKTSGVTENEILFFFDTVEKLDPKKVMTPSNNIYLPILANHLCGSTAFLMIGQKDN